MVSRYVWPISRQEFNEKLKTMKLLGDGKSVSQADYDELWEISQQYDRRIFTDVLARAKHVNNTIFKTASEVSLKSLTEILSSIDTNLIYAMSDSYIKIINNPVNIGKEQASKVLREIFYSLAEKASKQTEEIENISSVYYDMVRRVIDSEAPFRDNLDNKSIVGKLYSSCIKRVENFCFKTTVDNLAELMQYVKNKNGALYLSDDELMQYANECATFFVSSSEEKIIGAKKCLDEYKGFILSMLMKDETADDNKKERISQDLSALNFKEILKFSKTILTIPTDTLSRGFALLEGKTFGEALSGLELSIKDKHNLEKYKDLTLKFSYDELLSILKHGPSNLTTTAQSMINAVAIFDECFSSVFQSSDIDLNKFINYQNLSGVPVFNACNKRNNKNLLEMLEVMGTFMKPEDVYNYFCQDLRIGTVPVDFAKQALQNLILNSTGNDLENNLKNLVENNFGYFKSNETSGIKSAKSKKTRGQFKANVAHISIDSAEQLSRFLDPEDAELLKLLEEDRQESQLKLPDIQTALHKYWDSTDGLMEEISEVESLSQFDAVKHLGVLSSFLREANTNIEILRKSYANASEEDKASYKAVVEITIQKQEKLFNAFLLRYQNIESDLENEIKIRTKDKKEMESQSSVAKHNYDESIVSILKSIELIRKKAMIESQQNNTESCNANTPEIEKFENFIENTRFPKGISREEIKQLTRSIILKIDRDKARLQVLRKSYETVSKEPTDSKILMLLQQKQKLEANLDELKRDVSLDFISCNEILRKIIEKSKELSIENIDLQVVGDAFISQFFDLLPNKKKKYSKKAIEEKFNNSAMSQIFIKLAKSDIDHSVSVKILQEIYDENEQIINSCKQGVSEASSEIERLQTEISQLQFIEREEKDNKRKALKQEIVELESEIFSLESLICKLKAQLKKYNESSDAIEDLIQKLATLEAILKEKQLYLNDLKTNCASIN